VSKAVIFAWAVSALGMIFWVYGYFVPGSPPLINWSAHTPWWIADFLPNVQSEIGMVLTCLGTLLAYWPPQR
jgi:hypothetical protein